MIAPPLNPLGSHRRPMTVGAEYRPRGGATGLSIFAMILAGAVILGIVYLLVTFAGGDATHQQSAFRRRETGSDSRAAGMRGRVGGGFAGYDISLDAHPDGRLTGRFGGPVLGKDLVLTFDGTELTGRYGGAVEGKDIRATISGSSLTGRIGGDLAGADLDLVQEGDTIRGRIGGQIMGFDIDLRHSPSSGRLSGRIGGGLVGNDLDATVYGFPPLVAAAVAAAVYYQRRLQARRN